MIPTGRLQVRLGTDPFLLPALIEVIVQDKSYPCAFVSDEVRDRFLDDKTGTIGPFPLEAVLTPA